MNTFAMSAVEIGAILNLTPRRVGQYRDDGLLPIIERGRFDIAWLLYLRMGEQIVRNLRNRPDRDTLVALGWLIGVGNVLNDEDIAVFGKLFARNGLTHDAALLALGRAQEIKRRR